MADQKYICSGSKLTALGNAIREKAKIADKYTIDQMVTAVSNLASVEKVGSGDWFWGFYSDSALKTKLTDEQTAARIIDGQRVYAGYNSYVNPAGVYFATCSDKELQGMVAAHYAGNIDLTKYWSVGDTRKVALSAMAATGVGESHVAQDAEIVLMHAKPSWIKTVNNSKVPSFVWGLKDGLKESGYMNSSSTNSGGWASCARRTWCNSVFYKALPEGFRAAVRDSRIVTADGYSSSVGWSTDYCFLPAEKEVFGSNNYANSTAESTLKQLSWYGTSSNRVKHQGIGGSAYYWWERSPYSGVSGSFCLVNSDGSANNSHASYTSLLSPCGCF